jgi:hypothetical protein
LISGGAGFWSMAQGVREDHSVIGKPIPTMMIPALVPDEK